MKFIIPYLGRSPGLAVVCDSHNWVSDAAVDILAVGVGLIFTVFALDPVRSPPFNCGAKLTLPSI